MRCHRGCVITPEVLQTVTSRIVAGSSSSSFTKAGTGGYLVKFSTLARYRREILRFIASLSSLCKIGSIILGRRPLKIHASS